MDSPSENSSSASRLSATVTARDLLRWLRAALARNPFYILSALLLLYSMRLLSTDSRIFSRETPQLLFNFSSFELYELLLAGTAIVLARRMIWYDSGLLVGVENMFVFIPFILVSQALLLSNGIAVGLCMAGSLLAAGRIACLKRGLPKANIPGALVVMGFLLLCLNVALPVWTRSLHHDASVVVWDQRGAILKAREWNWLMPAIMTMAFALPSCRPRTVNEDGALYTRRCFPLLALALWVAGTGAHLYCIGYVYGLPWSDGLAVPVAWVGAWVLWKRRNDLDFIPQKFERMIGAVLLGGPALVLLGAQFEEFGSMAKLAAASAVIYGGIAIFQRRLLPLHLAAVCVALAFGTANAHHARLAVGFLGAYCVFWTLFSARPAVGMLGGLVISCLVLGMLPAKALANAAINMGFVYVLLHSLRWQRGEIGRWCLGILWLGQGVIWTSMDAHGGAWGTCASGIAVLAVYFGARGLAGFWGPGVIPLVGAASAVIAPARNGILLLERTPVGVLILLGSFILFALGTIAAITKSRWLPQRPPMIGNPDAVG